MQYVLFVLWLIGVVARTVVALGMAVAAFAAMVWQIVSFNDPAYHEFIANLVEMTVASRPMAYVLFFLPMILATLCFVAGLLIIRSIERGGRWPRL